MLLITASSARAATRFERPGPIGPEHDEISAAPVPGAPTPDSQQIAAALGLSHEHETNVAPRIGESRQPPEARVSTGSLLGPRCELVAGECEERLASRSGCAEIARWCLAHATSTQAP